MFVLVISRDYAPDDNPVSGIFEVDQAKALSDFGHKVALIVIRLGIRKNRKIGFSHFFYNGLEVYRFGLPLGRVFGKRIRLWVGQFALRRIYKKILKDHGKPDIAHAHFTETAAISTVLRRKYAIPFVFTEHSSMVNVEKIGKKEKFFGRVAHRHADKVIAVSSPLAKKIEQHFNIKSVVIPNIADILSFNKISEKQGKNFTFVSVGNLIHKKGFDLLIEAFNRCEFDKNVSLLIIGEGEERDQLEKQIEELGLTKQVRLLGRLPRKEIQKYLLTSSAFVLASRGETFGVVYIEAMATGLPVIATKCGGPEDFVNETNGLLIEPNNIEALKTAMIEMHQNMSRYDAEQIRKYAIEKFSPTTIAKEITEVYRTILE